MTVKPYYCNTMSKIRYKLPKKKNSATSSVQTTVDNPNNSQDHIKQFLSGIVCKLKQNQKIKQI